MAISNEMGLSVLLPCFQPSLECGFPSVVEDVEEDEGGAGSWRPLLMTVFSVVKLDVVSVAVITLTFGTVGEAGMGRFLVDELSKRLFLVPPKLLFRSIFIRFGSVRLSPSKIGVDSPVFLLRLWLMKS